MARARDRETYGRRKKEAARRGYSKTERQRNQRDIEAKRPCDRDGEAEKRRDGI